MTDDTTRQDPGTQPTAASGTAATDGADSGEQEVVIGLVTDGAHS